MDIEIYKVFIAYLYLVKQLSIQHEHLERIINDQKLIFEFLFIEYRGL